MGNIEVAITNSDRGDDRLSWRAPVFRYSVAISTVIACLVLVGHFAGIEWLTTLYPAGAPTSITVAFLVLALEASTGLAWHGRHRPNLRRASFVVAGLVVAAGIVMFAAGEIRDLPSSAGIPRSPDEIAAQLDVAAMPAGTSPLALLGITALGLSVILTSKKTAAFAQILVFAAAAMTLSAAVGYLLGSSSIYSSMPTFAIIGFPTVIMFFSASAAIIAANGDRAVTAEVSSGLVGGRLARRVLPAVLIAPIVIGWLRVFGQNLNLYGTAFGISLMVTSLVVTLGAMLLVGTIWLNKVDRERTQAEAESIERASRIADILEGAAEGVVTINSNGVITMANPRAKLAFARDDLMDVKIKDLIPSGLEALDVLDGSSSRTGFKRDLRMVGETSSGRLFPIEASLSKRVIRGETTFTLIFRDVSERVRAENRIRALNERLEGQVRRRTEQLNRTAGDLEAFSYSVSHDLRAPLRAMSGFARIIADDFGGDLQPEARHYLDRIQANAAHMSNLIDGLLEFSKIDRVAASRHDVDLARLVQEEIELLEPAIDGRAVNFEVAEMPSCNADPVLMRRVVANLLSNALKFTEGCDPAKIAIGFDEDLAAYFISDNGVGFDDQRADKLFEVFQRLHSRDKFPGAGIGLALTRRIVEKHGGSIWAKSQPHRGATFYFSVDEGKPANQTQVARAGVDA